MSRRIYPLNALRVFEAAARHLSFVEASEELSVTPAAVSHQVKKLEEYLGLPLFRRTQKGLLSTESGQLLATELRDVFLRLDTAMERVLDDDSQGTLSLSVAPTFAVMWLIPRLHRFSALHPDVDVRISTNLSLVDFQRDDVDAVIRLSKEQPTDLEVIKLCDETVTPMCSPRLLEGPGALMNPNDLSRHVLLHNHSMDYDPDAPTWRSWLDAVGASDVDDSRGTHFSLPDHGMQASMDGEGIVLGWRFLARKHVAAGRIVEPFDLVLPLGSSFYLGYPEAYTRRPNIVAFREWLLNEIHEDITTENCL
ncbi:MAG: LysR family glycine cleavage system transcriptional activator [Granulosicoccus sp.]|jgi:LysR family glycine cleavage system transcriptional activator